MDNNIEEDSGDSDLIEAVINGNIVECRRLLESKQGGDGENDDDYVVDIHEKNSFNGWSPIIWATTRGHTDIAELLLSKGANIHDRDLSGYSPILMTADYGHIDLVALLLSKGANVHDITDFGQTSLSMAHRDQVKSALLKWYTTMGIIMLQELGIIFIIDSESVIDLNQYING